MSHYSSRPWLRHYDYWVPHHMSYPRRPLHEILDTAAVDVPDRPATAFFGATLTYAELKNRSDRLAAAFDGIGLVKGDRVGIMLPNCPQYIDRRLRRPAPSARSSSTSTRPTRRAKC